HAGLRYLRLQGSGESIVPVPQRPDLIRDAQTLTGRDVELARELDQLLGGGRARRLDRPIGAIGHEMKPVAKSGHGAPPESETSGGRARAARSDSVGTSLRRARDSRVARAR